jgi:hypothetical protein
MNDDHKKAIFKCVSTVFEMFALSECECEDPTCTADQESKEAMLSIAQANTALEEDTGMTNPYMNVQMIEVDAFTAPGSERVN